jgi:hypothetical protein
LQRKSCNNCGSENVMMKRTSCNRYALVPKSTLQVLSSEPCNCNLPLVLLLSFRWIVYGIDYFCNEQINIWHLYAFKYCNCSYEAKKVLDSFLVCHWQNLNLARNHAMWVTAMKFHGIAFPIFSLPCSIHTSSSWHKQEAATLPRNNDKKSVKRTFV